MAKLKIFSLVVGCDVPAYKTIIVHAANAQNAEKRVRKDLSQRGFNSKYWDGDNDSNQATTDWSLADNARYVEDSIQEEVS